MLSLNVFLLWIRVIKKTVNVILNVRRLRAGFSTRCKRSWSNVIKQIHVSSNQKFLMCLEIPWTKNYTYCRLFFNSVSNIQRFLELKVNTYCRILENSVPFIIHHCSNITQRKHVSKSNQKLETKRKSLTHRLTVTIKFYVRACFSTVPIVNPFDASKKLQLQSQSRSRLNKLVRRVCLNELTRNESRFRLPRRSPLINTFISRFTRLRARPFLF